MDVVRRCIEADGPLTVADYMSLCLAHPDFGYYRHGEAIGAQGDFVTAPEISQVFGELIGIWVALTWQHLGTPERLHLVELGPGRGTMMRDILRTLRILPGLREAVQATLVEISPHLRAVQRATLHADNSDAAWCRSVAEASDRSDGVATIILANEFFDALPIHQYVRTGSGEDGRWRERVVNLGPNGKLCFTTIEANQAPTNPPSAQDGDIFESRYAALCGGGEEALASTFTAFASQAPTALLAIDYGHQGPSVGDTLQAMRNQSYADVLAAPGTQDITAHVDFAELAAVLSDVGYVCDGPITQAAFLAGLGFTTRVDALRQGKDAVHANAIETAAHRLVAEPGMGNHFKVLCARSNGMPQLVPFAPANEIDAANAKPD